MERTPCDEGLRYVQNMLNTSSPALKAFAGIGCILLKAGEQQQVSFFSHSNTPVIQQCSVFFFEFA